MASQSSQIGEVQAVKEPVSNSWHSPPSTTSTFMDQHIDAPCKHGNNTYKHTKHAPNNIPVIKSWVEATRTLFLGTAWKQLNMKFLDQN